MTLREIFEHYGVTQQMLVQRFAMKRQYPSLLWTGKRRLGHRLGKRIADAFDIPVEELLYPEDIDTPRFPRRTPPDT